MTYRLGFLIFVQYYTVHVSSIIKSLNPKKIQFFFLIFVIKFQSPLASVEVEKFRIAIIYFSEDKLDQISSYC